MKNNTSVQQERAVRKIFEHLQDALWHLQNSSLSEATKVEVDGLLHHADFVLGAAIQKGEGQVRS